MKSSIWASLVALALSALLIWPVSAADDEAEREASKLLDKVLTKCGVDVLHLYQTDEYPKGVYHWSLTQYKGFSHRLESAPLTDADRLNGLEWHGKLVLSGKNWRNGKLGDVWSEWFEDDAYGQYAYEISKRKGEKWEAVSGIRFSIDDATFTHPGCRIADSKVLQ